MAERVFEAAGLKPDEELVYRALLMSPNATAAEVATRLGISAVHLRIHLTRLQSLGMISARSTKPRRYTALPPVLAIEALVLNEEESLHRRAEELRRVRLAAAAFGEQLRSDSGTAPSEFIELLHGEDALQSRFEALQRVAQEEVLGFERPPYVLSPVATGDVQHARLAQGIRYRIIYARSSLETPGKLAQLEELAAAGEQARVHDDVPMKLALADRTLGLIPLNLANQGAPSALVIHESSLLVALRMLFDAMWEQAQPLVTPSTVRLPTTGSTDVLDQRIMTMLAHGLTDRSIARQLRLGQRTVARHVAKLMNELGAGTRFQAGWLASKRNPS